jgi:CelD/BcsL family acetyltransferase involved in cellulose biosynthesis
VAPTRSNRREFSLACRSADAPAANLSPGACTMMDLIMLALGLAFFALSVGYTIACDHL